MDVKRANPKDLEGIIFIVVGKNYVKGALEVYAVAFQR